MRPLLFFVLSLSLVAAKKPEPQWKIGKVLDSHLAKSSVAVGSTTNTTGTATATGSEGLTTASGQSTSSTSVDFANIRDNQLLVKHAKKVDAGKKIDVRITAAHRNS